MPDADVGLQRMLAALASPTRLAILQHLDAPRRASEVAATFGISRQAVRKHFEALAEAGLVRSRKGEGDGILVFEVEPGATQTMRHVLLRAMPLPAEGAGLTPTVAAQPRERPARPPAGAGILLLDGDAEARFLPLPHGTSWVLGRGADADVRLPHDPYVSARHALLRYVRSEWTIEDLGSTNGTHVDLRPLPPRAPRSLTASSIVTVGRTHAIVRGGG